MIEPVIQFVARPDLAFVIEFDAQRAMSNLQTRSGYTRRVRRGALVLGIFCGVVAASSTSSGCATQQPSPDHETSATGRDPIPQSLEQFQSAAARVLEETGVPGAGLALVRQSGLEWAGGVGYADRDRQTPVTADTPFRVGSISKTFVAMALVQLSENGLIDLDDLVTAVAPDVGIDNPWEGTHPVRVINLLQHTAGFDDMHFNELYVPAGEAERPLAEVLRINPRSRRVRWPPGTRMSYSNPGYAVAGHILELTASMPYEDYIEQEIFAPLEMVNSTFRLTEETQKRLAQGYDGPEGPPVNSRQIYLRPAGNMVSTSGDLARFVQMLLGWGELGEAFVIDPEYLGNMEQPRTTLAAAAGLRNGYGTGIFTTLDLPYKVLGHNGAIEGFSSSYAYSPSRDAGYVVLLNSTGARAGEAMRRLSAMAIGYLKRDVEPAQMPATTIASEVLEQYVGYYHDANPRNQITWPLQTLFSGREIVREADALYAVPILGQRARLVPVSESMFRLEHELEASRVFTTDADGVMVLAGPQLFARRTSRLPLDIMRVSLVAGAIIIASVFGVAIVWVARWKHARPRGFWELKFALLLCPLVVLMPAAGAALTPLTEWGVRSVGTVAVYVGTLAVPTMALIVSVFTVAAIRERASWLLVTYAGLVALAMSGIGLYLSHHDLIGVRLWHY